MSDAPARVLLADPAWLFKDKIQGNGRGAIKHYACLKQYDLLRFPLPPLADNCMLLLWRVAAMQQEALDVVRAWGFVLKSEIVWEKLTATGKDHFGMGHYVRASHEVCLLATRGRVKVADRSVRSRFAAPVGKHSEKPDEIYTLAERLVPRGPYVELFARRRRDGWTQYGDQLEPAEAKRAS